MQLFAEQVTAEDWSTILRTVVDWLAQGLVWMLDFQALLISFVLTGATGWEIAVKWALLLLPAGLLVAGVWGTMASLYTLPFRSGRSAFLTALLMCWWDAGRSAWLFWAGALRFLVVLVGWLWGLLRLAVELTWKAVKRAAASPFALLDWTSRQYFQPGVPWVAFLLTVLWSAIEATIFTFTLRPTLTEVLADIVGFEPHAAVLTTLLWLFLFFLIAGSFACLEVLAEAVRSRQIGRIAQMVTVEVFVAFFEVLFLYRELIDAVTPWLAQQTGEEVRLGLFGTLGLAFFGWVGVRGMTWFLFGRYGTPALLAVLARQTMASGQPADVPLPTPPDFWQGPIAALKSETEWFKREARQVFELLSLPVLQLLAAAMNFPVVVLRGRPAFILPFRSLDDVLASTPLARATTPRVGGNRAAEGAL
jgi:hypothetical protein